NNCLFSSVNVPRDDETYWPYGNSWSFVNCTFNNAYNLAITDSTQLALTNCILANILGIGSDYMSGDYNGFDSSSPQFGSHKFTDAAPFVTAGGGSHYLRSLSPFRGVGTTFIDPTLLSSLRTKT